jgi:hypothetical protein
VYDEVNLPSAINFKHTLVMQEAYNYKHVK